MRVLLVTKTLAEFPEEAGRPREISKLGVHLSVVVPARWRGRPVETQRLKFGGYEHLTLDCWFSDRESKRLRNHLHLYPRISGVIGSRSWDLVHIDEEPFNLATYLVVRGCRKHKRRAVFTTWQSLMKRYPPPFSFFERYVFENAVAGIAGNKEALEILRRRGFGGPVACVPQHGVDPALFQRLDASDLREKMGLKDAFVIGFVGQFGHWKGLDTLIKALALLPNECALVFVGTGPDVSRFRCLAQELGLSARVRWESWVDKSQVVKYMCAFDVFVLPSRTLRNCKEQFGRVLVEAMACETCVVGSDSGEIPNVIGDAGLIFREGDAQDLASCLRRLMEDCSLRETLSRRGRERVLERFTYERIARGTVDFYKQICSAGG